MIQVYDISIHRNGVKTFFKSVNFEGDTKEEYRKKLHNFMSVEFPNLPSINDKGEGKEFWTAYGNIFNY